MRRPQRAAMQPSKVFAHRIDNHCSNHRKQGDPEAPIMMSTFPVRDMHIMNTVTIRAVGDYSYSHPLFSCFLDSFFNFSVLYTRLCIDSAPQIVLHSRIRFRFRFGRLGLAGIWFHNVYPFTVSSSRNREHYTSAFSGSATLSSGKESGTSSLATPIRLSAIP
jgi:hypothetical protein